MHKNSIYTISRKEMNVFKPTLDMIDIEDIAHALSNICRFTGQIPKFYSVAQHSVLCAQSVSNVNKQAALLHDASEAYLNDIATPIKNNLPDYKKVEDNLMKVIAKKFNFEYPLNNEVHLMDKILFNAERRTFRDTEESGITLQSFNISIWNPEKARKEFMKMYKNLFSS